MRWIRLLLITAVVGGRAPLALADAVTLADQVSSRWTDLQRWFLHGGLDDQGRVGLFASDAFLQLSERSQTKILNAVFMRGATGGTYDPSGILIASNVLGGSSWVVGSNGKVRRIGAWGPLAPAPAPRRFFISGGWTLTYAEKNVNVVGSAGVGTYLFANVWDFSIRAVGAVQEDSLSISPGLSSQIHIPVVRGIELIVGGSLDYLHSDPLRDPAQSVSRWASSAIGGCGIYLSRDARADILANVGRERGYVSLGLTFGL